MEYKLKRIIDIFGKDGISKYGDVENVRALDDGNVNYISTTSFNNGLYRKVNNSDYLIEKGNCITVGIDGSFTAFYQDEQFVRTTNISILRHSKLNKYNALYLVTVINLAISKFNYGIKLKSKGVLENTEILIPCNGLDPDWDYMTNYLKTIYDKQKKLFTTKNKNKNIKFDFKKWKLVQLSSIMYFERGQRYRKEDQVPGIYPYISSSADNNGVDNMVSPGNRSKIYHDTLTLANSGSVGKCFYHVGEFVASDHVHVLSFKDGSPISLKVGLFLIPLIEMNAGRYMFNKEINDKGKDEIYVMLPYNDNKVDFDFIEKFMSDRPNMDLIKL